MSKNCCPSPYMFNGIYVVSPLGPIANGIQGRGIWYRQKNWKQKLSLLAENIPIETLPLLTLKTRAHRR